MADSILAAVIRPTVTRVRRNTASITSRMIEIGNDHSVFYGVAADDPARRDFEIEDGVARRRELVHQFFGRGAVIENAFIALFENHHAAALDALIVGADGGGHEIGEGDVGDEAAALVYLQP